MASEGSSSEPVNWECPVCFEVPPKQIYQCKDGHSMCALCVTKLERCPICRVKISERNLVRNRGLEGVLDKLKFKCPWNANGCTEELSRNEVSEHEGKCLQNPNAHQLCRFFSEGYQNCNFKLTLESLQDQDILGPFFLHLLFEHSIHTKSVAKRVNEKLKLRLDGFKTGNDSSPTKYLLGDNFYPQIYTVDHENGRHMFALGIRICLGRAQKETFSFSLVELTPDVGSENSPFQVKMTFGMVGKRGLVPPIYTWLTKPMKIAKFIIQSKKPIAEQRPLYCDVPFCLMEKKLGRKGEFEIGFSCGRRL